MRLTALLALVACSASLLQAADARNRAADYPVTCKAGDIEIGAEYMVRSVSHENVTFQVPDHLVVEIAVYPPPGREIQVNAQDFMLRLNGKKELLHAQVPGMVAAAVKYPDWQQRPELIGGASVGDAGVVLGRTPSVARFPGDNRPAERRIPNPVPPVASTPDGAPPKDALDLPAMLQAAALPEEPRRKPVAGFVYFAWDGKLKSIKTVDLVVRTESGDLVTARLR